MLYLKDILKSNESNKGSTSGEDNNQVADSTTGSNNVDLMSLNTPTPPAAETNNQSTDAQPKPASAPSKVTETVKKLDNQELLDKTVNTRPGLEEYIKVNEGNAERAEKRIGKGTYGTYVDGEGISAGIGHYLTKDELARYKKDPEYRKYWDNMEKEEALKIFKTDLANATKDLDKFLQENQIAKKELPPQVYYALQDMTFNMGSNRLRKFKKMTESLKQKDYREAGRQVLLGANDGVFSRYYNQTGRRALNNALLIASAVAPSTETKNDTSSVSPSDNANVITESTPNTIKTNLLAKAPEGQGNKAQVADLTALAAKPQETTKEGQGEEPKQDIQGGVTTSNDDPYAQTLDYLNTTLKDKEGLLKTTKIPAKQILQKHYAQLKQDNMSRQQILSWAKIASKMINAITQYAAAREGLRKNLDLSGVKTEQADWDKEIDRAFKQYQTDYKSLLDREKAEDAEIARAERKEASLKKEINALRGLMARTEDSRARERARRAAEAKRYELAREREDRLSRQAEEKKKKEDELSKRTKDEESAWFYVNDPKQFNDLSTKEKKKLRVKLGPAFAKYGFTVDDSWWSGPELLPKNPDQDFIIDPDALNPEDQKAFEFAISKPKDPRSKVLLKMIKNNYKK